MAVSHGVTSVGLGLIAPARRQVAVGLTAPAQGFRAGVPASVLASAALILGVRTLGDIVPIAGPLFADVFTAHKWAARMVAESIDRRLGIPQEPQRSARSWGAGGFELG